MAEFSDDDRFRYSLYRVWAVGPLATFVLLNPSKATEKVMDPTVRRCRSYAQAWGYGGVAVVNLFAYRATDPVDLHAEHRTGAPVVGFNNDRVLARVAAESSMVVCGWGATRWVQERAEHVVAAVGAVRSLHVLQLTKQGGPSHPLYLRKDLTPTPWAAEPAAG